MATLWVVVSLSEKLKAAMTEAGMNKSQLARALAGKGATDRQVSNQRGLIYRWLGNGGITNRKAERLAVVLDKPLDHFKESEPDPPELDPFVVQLARELLRVTEKAIHNRPDQSRQWPGEKS